MALERNACYGGHLDHGVWVQLSICQCCNLSLGFKIKARACKGAGQEGSSGVTSHFPKNVGECKGMNPHTPK
jgi:hypothetical protein